MSREIYLCISHGCTISAGVDFIFWKYSGACTHTRHHQAPIPSQYLLQSWQAAQCRGSITTRGNNGGYVNPGGFFWKILPDHKCPVWWHFPFSANVDQPRIHFLVLTRLISTFWYWPVSYPLLDIDQPRIHFLTSYLLFDIDQPRIHFLILWPALHNTCAEVLEFSGARSLSTRMSIHTSSIKDDFEVVHRSCNSFSP